MTTIVIVMCVMAILWVGFLVCISRWSKASVACMKARHTRWQLRNPLPLIAEVVCVSCDHAPEHCNRCEILFETLTKEV